MPLIVLLTLPTFAIAEPNTEQIAQNIYKTFDMKIEPRGSFIKESCPIIVEAPKVPPAPLKQVITQDISEVQQSIIKWAIFYNQNPDNMLRIAKCESTFNPTSINYGYFAGGGNPTGLFQYLPETWNRYQRKLGVSGLDIYNYEHQAQLTAFAFSIGGSSEWECK